MHFRRFCLRLTLDLEHILKTKLIKDFNLNDSCDGYQIVSDYLTTNEALRNELTSFKSFGYTAKDVILAKYSGNLAIWNFIEIIEFGKFINFCEYYYRIYPDNLFDENYAGSVIVNDGNGRFFEPADGVNWSAGFSISKAF
mgnify:CR=1 FL=1